MKQWHITPSDTTLNLIQKDVALPEPGVGEIRVKVRAVSLNFRDLLVAGGNYPSVGPDGVVPLSDGAGEITALGDGVEGLKIGDRIVNTFWREWMDGPYRAGFSDMGGGIDGMLAEEVVLSAEALVKIPDYMSYSDAATLPVAALTAWNALVYRAEIKAGDTVLLLGTGGVSIFALQFAKSLGATIIITSSSNDKLTRAKALGADHTVNYKETPNWSEAVLELTGGIGVDAVIETGGPGTLQQSLEAVRVGGHVSLIGVLDSPEATISPIPVLFKYLRLDGLMVGSREMFESMLTHMDTHRITPVIDESFPVEQVEDAFAALSKGGHMGKIVVTL
ncbi:MAG: NAD(P)-dependent alcohol dehydrogenase [Kordiimonadaceae bacterium]|nr:NAD(P)-dependent alcohol dehydrogenase [Kordiimonadaceae bacterium]